jgi:hypothetical protein
VGPQTEHANSARRQLQKNKNYINANAAFWNDQDWHGGEVNREQEYGLRIDCVFTDEFRKKLGIEHLQNY